MILAHSTFISRILSYGE